jgi:hypothetical protein
MVIGGLQSVDVRRPVAPIAEGFVVVRSMVLRIQHHKVDKKEGSTVVPQ